MTAQRSVGNSQVPLPEWAILLESEFGKHLRPSEVALWEQETMRQSPRVSRETMLGAVRWATDNLPENPRTVTRRHITEWIKGYAASSNQTRCLSLPTGCGFCIGGRLHFLRSWDDGMTHWWLNFNGLYAATMPCDCEAGRAVAPDWTYRDHPKVRATQQRIKRWLRDLPDDHPLKPANVLTQDDSDRPFPDDMLF